MLVAWCGMKKSVSVVLRLGLAPRTYQRFKHSLNLEVEEQNCIFKKKIDVVLAVLKCWNAMSE